MLHYWNSYITILEFHYATRRPLTRSQIFNRLWNCITLHYQNSVILPEFHYVTLPEFCCITKILLSYWVSVTLQKMSYIIEFHCQNFDTLWYWNTITLLYFWYIARIPLYYSILLHCQNSVLLPEIC